MILATTNATDLLRARGTGQLARGAPRDRGRGVRARLGQEVRGGGQGASRTRDEDGGLGRRARGRVRARRAEGRAAGHLRLGELRPVDQQWCGPPTMNTNVATSFPEGNLFSSIGLVWAGLIRFQHIFPKSILIELLESEALYNGYGNL